jgi:hypothetical protein
MTVWLAGMQMTADRLNDHTADAQTASGLVPSSGWSVNEFYARKVNGVTEVHCYLLRTGATITATTGNVADQAICVLPVGWRPDHTVNGTWGDGTSSGEAILSNTGTVTLRTASSDIIANRNLRYSAVWISENS